MLEDIIRNKLEEMIIFAYSDGCIMFDPAYSTPIERAKFREGGMVDTLVRELSKSVKESGYTNPNNIQEPSY